MSATQIQGKKFSSDTTYVIDHFFVKPTQSSAEVNVLPNKCNLIYDDDWWVVLVETVNVEEQDATCNFLHRTGQSEYYYWPQTQDRAYVPLNKFLAILDPPRSSSNGRKYLFDKKQIEQSDTAFKNQQKK